MKTERKKEETFVGQKKERFFFKCENKYSKMKKTKKKRIKNQEKIKENVRKVKLSVLLLNKLWKRMKQTLKGHG